MAVTAGTPIELVQGVYGRLAERTEQGRQRLGRPLTLTEKILVNHLADPDQSIERGDELISRAKVVVVAVRDGKAARLPRAVIAAFSR